MSEILGGKKTFRLHLIFPDPKNYEIQGPVIAICNDLKAKSLKSLKSVARVVEMKSANVEKLKNRVRQILAAEKVRFLEGAIIDLIREAQGDVRATLNTMQLLSASNTYIDNQVYNLN